MKRTALLFLVGFVSLSAKADPLKMEDLLPETAKPIPRRVASLTPVVEDAPSVEITVSSAAPSRSPWDLNLMLSLGEGHRDFHNGFNDGSSGLVFGLRSELRRGWFQLELDARTSSSTDSFHSPGSINSFADRISTYSHRHHISGSLALAFRPEINLGRGMRIMPRAGLGIAGFSYESNRYANAPSSSTGSYFGPSIGSPSNGDESYSERAGGWGPSLLVGVEFNPSEAFGLYADVQGILAGKGSSSSTSGYSSLYDSGKPGGGRVRMGVIIQIGDNVFLGLEKESRHASHQGVRTSEDETGGTLQFRW